jgi:hypothetical protein
MPALSRNNEDQDSKRQSLRRELGRGGGCYMILSIFVLAVHGTEFRIVDGIPVVDPRRQQAGSAID